MTGRLPFNAGRSRASDGRPAKPAGGEAVYSVRRLAELVGDALDTSMPKSLRVRGEIRGRRERTHLYFDLADGEAVIPCVIFASSARALSTRLSDGDEVVLTGRLDFYAKAGKLSLIATRAEPVGEGRLAEELKRLVAELTERGWLDPERKRPLPRMPKRIAVVTSRSSAAWQDVIETARRRAPYVELVLADAPVQGDAAAQAVAARVRQISDHAEQAGIDAIMITRGGGSMEDLWAFNDPGIAEAIIEASVPVVAAIGHETDTTITELVADVRASTPTQAAVLLTPDTHAITEQLGRTHERLSRAMHRALVARTDWHVRSCASLQQSIQHTIVERSLQQLELAVDRLQRASHDAIQQRRHRVLGASGTLAGLHPTRTAERRVQADAHRLGLAVRRLRYAVADRVTRGRFRAEALSRELAAVGPAAVLERGYTLTTDETGTLIRTAAATKPGQTLLTRFHDGQTRSVVDGETEPSPLTQPKRSYDPGPSADQQSLF